MFGVDYDLETAEYTGLQDKGRTYYFESNALQSGADVLKDKKLEPYKDYLKNEFFDKFDPASVANVALVGDSLEFKKSPGKIEVIHRDDFYKFVQDKAGDIHALNRNGQTYKLTGFKLKAGKIDNTQEPAKVAATSAKTLLKEGGFINAVAQNADLQKLLRLGLFAMQPIASNFKINLNAGMKHKDIKIKLGAGVTNTNDVKKITAKKVGSVTTYTLEK